MMSLFMSREVFNPNTAVYSQENKKRWVKIKTLSKMHFMTLFFKSFKIKLMNINKEIYNLFSFMGRRVRLFTPGIKITFIL